MLTEKDALIIQQLRENARISTTAIAQKADMPVSTVFDRMRCHEHDIITKYVALLDFAKLGYHAKTKIAIKVIGEERQQVFAYLSQDSYVNSLYKINFGFDFFIELI